MKRIKIPENTGKYALFPFYRNGKPVDDGILWGMTLKAAGQMAFRWAEQNPNRTKILEEIAGGASLPSRPRTAQVQLDHTRTVKSVYFAGDSRYNIADGIITRNKFLMPVVTVADCLALHLYDFNTGAFGVVHSGWKGTGIVENAVRKMNEEYGSRPCDICVSLGAHIRNCCYAVNEERAVYFMESFGKDCASPLEEGEKSRGPENWSNLKGKIYRLSLEKANLNILQKIGIRDENIAILDECTCCNTKFGSNRRETAEGKKFTVQAAFVRW